MHFSLVSINISNVHQHLLFQRLMHDNDVAGRKLVSQEEDWRLQNQTLLEELQKLVIRYLWKIVKIFKSDCSGTKSLRRSMRRLGNENWKGSLTSFPWRLDFEQISFYFINIAQMLKCLIGIKRINSIFVLKKTIKDDEDENERDWKGEAKEANRRLQEKKEEVS